MTCLLSLSSISAFPVGTLSVDRALRLVRQGIDGLAGCTGTTASDGRQSMSALQQRSAAVTATALFRASEQTQLGADQFPADAAQTDERSGQMSRIIRAVATTTTCTTSTTRTTAAAAGSAPNYDDDDLTNPCPSRSTWDYIIYYAKF